MLLDLLQWLGDSAAGKFLAAHRAAFAVTQAFHLLGLAAVGGGGVAISLTALGVIFRRIGPVALARSLSPLLFCGLLVMATSGLLLVAAGPAKYYYNPLFRWKLLAIALAVAIQLLIFPGLGLLKRLEQSPVPRVLGLLSLAAWVGATILGRWVGLI